MASLVDHVDRISALASSVRASAAPTSGTPISGPFTRAILDMPLGDLIRDIDPAEIGLFTLVQPKQPTIAEVDTGSVEITRVEFLGATPLRKPPSSKYGKGDAARAPREHDPEVYANAAVKYLERYQSIRPMPRASEQALQIIERLEEVRANIHNLSEQLKQHSDADAATPPLSPKSSIKKEERQINELQSQIQYLRERKEELAKKKARGPLRAKREPKPLITATPTEATDEREDTFWNTPGAAARTLHFTGDSLLDEEVDLANVTTASFGTPLSLQKKIMSPPAEKEAVVSEEPADDIEEEEIDEVLGEIDESVDPTVVLGKLPAASPPEKQFYVAPDPAPEEVEEALPPPKDAEPAAATPQHRQKVKVTTELERIVEKIWATVGEVIMPGHPFDALGRSTSKSKPPRAKETMAYLRELATHSPTPSSPSASSFSSFSAPSGPNAAPTAQQVLTAHMLLALLTAPGHAQSLRVLKEDLTQKAASIGTSTGAGLIGGSAVTKPLYGCVAKRLLKIERGAGEQVVKFDL
ncbi:hypothetical protein BD309DRAFT_1011154 [Dichomitus squalens]|uniref:Uncharacterized protein n=1 Tax=Dichomitus squalens TaxID=114155 RepID=A0A4Q9Q9R3_9APHY|nr:hypothetical protein BD309DRAFT_1011154 [Dichomitus squalens]TBU64265.1 hypothetical protein BD310DRAFT_914348 [Dichomitus squalens]